MKFKKYLKEVKITFHDEMIGTQSGQSDLRLTAYIDKVPVGWIDYSDYQGEISIKMIEVKPEYRRKGIGKDLVLKLQKEYPKTEINLGMLTGDGVRLIKSIKSKLYVDKSRINKKKRLEKELSDLKKEEQKLMKQLKPIKDDNDKKGIERNVKIGDRLNDISDRIYDIEEELYDL